MNAGIERGGRVSKAHTHTHARTQSNRNQVADALARGGGRGGEHKGVYTTQTLNKHTPRATHKYIYSNDNSLACLARYAKSLKQYNTSSAISITLFPVCIHQPHSLWIAASTSYSLP